MCYSYFFFYLLFLFFFFIFFFFFFQAEDGIRDLTVTGVQTCALPISLRNHRRQWPRNTRYQAGRYPLTWAGLSPAGSHQLCLAHSLDHLVSALLEKPRYIEPEHLGGLEIDH